MYDLHLNGLLSTAGVAGSGHTLFFLEEIVHVALYIDCWHKTSFRGRAFWHLTFLEGSNEKSVDV